MGIEGIEYLKGDTMESSQQSQPPVEGQQGESASPPPEQVAPTPAHEEADRAAGQPDEDDQVVEGDAQEPAQTDTDPGDDAEVSPPADLPEGSLEADPEDQHGASDHPES